MTLLTDAEYHQRVEDTLLLLQRQLDEMLDILDWETHGDILAIEFEDGEKVVINKQPPLQQLWFACKEEGKQFAWTGTDWIDVRDGTSFTATLKRLFGRKGVRF